MCGSYREYELDHAMITAMSDKEGADLLPSIESFLQLLASFMY
jgi:hypothetical protein